MFIKYSTIILTHFTVISGYLQAGLIEDLQKAWSQVEADVAYGEQFLKEHLQVTKSRKDTELLRFLNSCNQLNEHRREFWGLKYNEKKIDDKEVGLKMNKLLEIHREILALPLRKPGEKRVVLPPLPFFPPISGVNNQEIRESDIELFEDDDSSVDTEVVNSPDPNLRFFFDQSQSEGEIDPLLSEGYFQSTFVENPNQFDDIR